LSFNICVSTVVLSVTLSLKCTMHVAVSCCLTGLVEQHQSNWQSLHLQVLVAVAWVRFADQHRYGDWTTFCYCQ